MKNTVVMKNDFRTYLELNRQDKNFTIKWNIVETAGPYTCGTR